LTALSTLLTDNTTTQALTTPSADVVNNLITLTNTYNKYSSQWLPLQRAYSQDAIQRFYRDTVIPYKRYLLDSDITSSLKTAITDSVTYFGTGGTTAATPFNTLATGKTYTGIRDQMNQAFRDIVSALLTRLNGSYTTWTGYGMTAPTTPSDFATYATTAWSTDNGTVTNSATAITAIAPIRDKICAAGAYWPNLVTAMQTFTTPKIQLLQNIYTFATQATTTSIAANALTSATHNATVGLGQTAVPLIFLQPVVTGTGASGSTRSFYGMVINSGIAANTNPTLLGFVWGTTTGPTGNNTSKLTPSSSGYFATSPVITANPGDRLYVRAYASNSASTYTADGTGIVYSNEITFVL
jgi:hypothetical protein